MFISLRQACDLRKQVVVICFTPIQITSDKKAAVSHILAIIEVHGGLFIFYVCIRSRASSRGVRLFDPMETTPGWRHHMEILSGLLELGKGDPPVSKGFSSQRTRCSPDVVATNWNAVTFGWHHSYASKRHHVNVVSVHSFIKVFNQHP